MHFDLLIAGGRVIDGTGNPGYVGDVGVRGDTIAAVGYLPGATATRRIDADGLVVCPGFIDMHVHSDVMLLADPRHEAKVRQGVTTELLGQDGLSYAPLTPANLRRVRRYLAGLNGDPPIAWDWSSVAELLDRFDRRVAVSVAYLAPHNALRIEALGWAARTAPDAELARSSSRWRAESTPPDPAGQGAVAGPSRRHWRRADRRAAPARLPAGGRRGGRRSRRGPRARPRAG